MTKQEILWASQHDWFHKASFEGAVIVVDTDPPVPVLRTFTSYQKLRAWAGY